MGNPHFLGTCIESLRRLQQARTINLENRPRFQIFGATTALPDFKAHTQARKRITRVPFWNGVHVLEPLESEDRRDLLPLEDEALRIGPQAYYHMACMAISFIHYFKACIP